MIRYPPADRDGVVDVLHGVSIPDPYRYLEDPDDERTRAFVAAQNALSRPYLAALPATAEFRAMTGALLSAPRRGAPWERGGRYFVLGNPGDRDQDLLYTAGSLDALLTDPGILVDPNGLSADGTVAMTATRVSPHGSFVAYALADGGSDWRTIRVRDAATALDLPDVLTWTKWIDPTWLPDESGFLYWRYPPPDGRSAALTAAMGAGELALHRLGDDPASDAVIWSRPDLPEWLAEPWVADDGRWLVLVANPGTDPRSTVHARRLLMDGTGRIVVQDESVTVVGDLADAHRVVGSAADTLFLRTERGAVRGRLVAVDLDAPDAGFRTVVAERPTDVLVDAVETLGGFVLTWSGDAAHRIELVDLAGAPRPGPDLPEPVSITAVHAHAASAEVFAALSSFTRPAAGHHWRAGADPVAAQELPLAGGSQPLRHIRCSRERARSADGTAVPMTVLRRHDVPAGPRPTLLYGYGGFDIPVLPAFSALFAPWVQAGGVLAVANLRGGGEFGTDWHRAGMLHHKQRVFDDFIGCAEHLVSQGTTTPGQLAIHGRSNGGLLVGAAMTQRPDLFAAALPGVGVLDMLRFQLFTIGWAWMTEYGNPEDADDFAVLHDYSPLHRLRPGTAYPATLVCTGDHDDRVVPGHSLKFVAELQRCQSGAAPTLVRVETRAGHGMGKPLGALADEYADQLAFAAAHTGLDVGARTVA